jgi:hypothetical protein
MLQPVTTKQDAPKAWVGEVCSFTVRFSAGPPAIFTEGLVVFLSSSKEMPGW